MKLERRLKRLEAALTEEKQKREALILEVFTLRAMLIGVASINKDASGAQRSAVLSRAQDRLASYLMGSGFPLAEAEEALAAPEDMFYEIDAARTAAGQKPGAMS